MAYYDDDPYLAPIHQEVDALAQRIQELRRQQQAEREQRWAEQQNQQVNHWHGQLVQLKQQDPEVDQAAVVRFAAAHGLRDMNTAYKLLTFDRDVKAAEERGLARAQGRQPRGHAPPAAEQPSIRPASTPPATQRHDVLHSAMGDAMRNALADPDVREGLDGWSKPDLSAIPIKKDVPSFSAGF